MVEMTLEVSDELAERIYPMHSWLSTVLELSLVGYQTLAAQTASEIIHFLSTNPTPAQVVNYHVSQRGQERLRRLLALNQSALLSEDEQQELDELEQIEDIFNQLKLRIAVEQARG